MTNREPFDQTQRLRAELEAMEPGHQRTTGTRTAGDGMTGAEPILVAIAVLCLVVLFWPWAIGLVDLAWWMITGSPVSSIPWDGARGITLIIWPFGIAVIAGFVVAFFSGH